MNPSPVAVLGPGAFNRTIDDKDHLLYIFPEEVWTIIFDGIREPETLKSLSNASPFFRNILLPRRSQYLFPSVWRILGTKYHEKCISYHESDLCYTGRPMDIADDKDGSGETSTCRKSTEEWFANIIKLRLVCRTWCQAVDNLYEDPALHLQMGDDPGHRYDYLVESLVLQLFRLDNSPGHLHSFSSHFQGHCDGDGVAIRNPFLGRAVHINVDMRRFRRQEIQQSFDKLREIFIKFGQYVWYCQLCVQDGFSSRLEWYSIVQSLLELMPNLRTLYYIYQRPTWYPEERSELQEFINLNPLPTHQNLELLKISSSYLAPPTFQEILRSGRHVSLMEVSRCSSSRENYNISTLTVPNLRKLAVRFHSEVDFESFCAHDIKWSLSALDIAIENPSLVEWARLFYVIGENCGDTLETLVVNLPMVNELEAENKLIGQSGNLRLNLSRLKNLRVTVHNLSCFDFLLPLKDTLETLNIEMFVKLHNEYQVKCADNIEHGKVIKLLSMADKPMDSNIWGLFPKLKELIFHCNICTWKLTENRKYYPMNYMWSHYRHEWQTWTAQNALEKNDQNQ